MDPSAVESTTSGTSGSGSGGGGSLPGTLIGDVTGALTANTVVAIRTITTPVAVAGDDSKTLTYRNSALAYVLRHPQVKNVTKTGDYLVTADDFLVLVDTTLGNVTISLPTAVGIKDTAYMVKKISADANMVTINPAGVELIDSSLTAAIKMPLTALLFASNNVAWWIV